MYPRTRINHRSYNPTINIIGYLLQKRSARAETKKVDNSKKTAQVSSVVTLSKDEEMSK